MRPKRRSSPRSSRGERGCRLGRGWRGDPGPPFLAFVGGENPHLARQQEAQRVDRMAHPAGIGDDGDPFPLRQVIDREIEIVPAGTGKP